MESGNRFGFRGREDQGTAPCIRVLRNELVNGARVKHDDGRCRDASQVLTNRSASLELRLALFIERQHGFLVIVRALRQRLRRSRHVQGGRQVRVF